MPTNCDEVAEQDKAQEIGGEMTLFCHDTQSKVTAIATRPLIRLPLE